MKSFLTFVSGAIIGVIIGIYAVPTKKPQPEADTIEQVCIAELRELMSELKTLLEQENESLKSAVRKSQTAPAGKQSQTASRKESAGTRASGKAESAPTALSQAAKPSATSTEDGTRKIKIRRADNYVELYVNMDKESVRSILGEPESVSMMTIGSAIHETWRYKKPVSTLEFVNGKLKNIYQY